MTEIRDVSSYLIGAWCPPDAEARPIHDAATGRQLARAGHGSLDTAGILRHAREVGGPALRQLSFHDRARMIKALAQHLDANKQALYDLSFSTGATLRDHAFDIDGGIGTLFVFASKARREMPDATVYVDGPVEALSRDGSFVGQHICTPLRGAAIHINAFNFPVWGMLEKLAPTWLAGMPAIVKPATATCHVTELAVRIMLDSGHVPDGALQLVCGGIGDMLDHVSGQDVISFTGSAETAARLRSTPAIQREATRFSAEQDSLNATILGPDVPPDAPEFDLFVSEVIREMTVKAGQKCTAIRRILVPADAIDPVITALCARLSRITIGAADDPETDMGPLVSSAQCADVRAKAALIASEAACVFGDPDAPPPVPGGAFFAPLLFFCRDPDAAHLVHETEAFGPVATLMPYRDLDHAVALANRGQGSLVASLITHDPEVARTVTLGAAACHGRIYLADRTTMKAGSGHGAPLPHMIHGGPGRAGGGEELGGIRAVLHYMQRTAVQGSPDMLRAITGRHVPGATPVPAPAHPFTRGFDALHIGETLETEARTVTLDDIETFAHFTGDTFYAHMDDAAAARNPFFPGRVAHGYLLLSFAAGLFVHPEEGPVLANTGLDALRFLKPVSPGDSVSVLLTVMSKTPRNPAYGEVRWHVKIKNQNAEPVAEYELLTMNAFDTPAA
ncbi:phenylacetic acid degradation bifunctional protein PaaZ [Cognatishimia sp. F0-27]|uniref:phenylacetic acid degradation bifunctional protein PaaZ n=1 Tax=Cognatishimia sp. F0-27 TaxID=2816855 RepID=UPI001D0C4B60|nr:phenylacetic acid degradation bifunctional protein PaaZ [Cognatishimia sp. F0-27]MCC1492605.1 phenylacetic acid degradation bifunctional protein PaaZ [Cognatishimia sp. F0-27]